MLYLEIGMTILLVIIIIFQILNYLNIKKNDLVNVQKNVLEKIANVNDSLEDNIEDYKGEKGWCVGSDDYDVTGSCTGLSVFMQRRKDAMLFIKTWSKYKKPINYCQYFTDIRKRLDLKTLKYKTQ